jgi:beta-lactamase superfamily II metal-dependent hydrolase
MANQGDSADAIADADGIGEGTYHFLDVGGSLYGDCILVEFGNVRVLIDGSHVEDFAGQAGHLPIPDQIKSILGGTPPYDISLLVVTHGHADHIGCLPQLVSNGIVKPKFALVVDAALGFGRVNDHDAIADTILDASLAAVAAAMREEDASFLNDADLEAFLDVAAGVEARYQSFLADLTAGGTTVIEYRGDPLPAALVDLMAPTGMSLIGPTLDQLKLCAAQIGATNKDSSDFVSDARDADAAASRADLYRQVAANIDAADGAGGRGAGMNCQSITLAFGKPGERALLAGDMQFARPEVSGVAELMPALRASVVAQGPYALFKTTHHTAVNGQDEAFLTELGNPSILVHSGGSTDKGHPNGAVMTSLRKRGTAIRFARTDRNQIISVKPHLGAAPEAITISGGALNDFSLNKMADQPNEPPREAAEATAAPIVPAPAPTSVIETKSIAAPLRTAPQVIIVNLPDSPVSMTVGDVAINVTSLGTAISTPRAAQQSDVAAPVAPTPPPLPTGKLASGRPLPRLLFVTNKQQLAQNIGSREAAAAIAMIEAAGQPLVSVAPETAAVDVRTAASADPAIKGIVILGGYDCVPSFATDAIDPALRATLGHLARSEPDQFIVWSDEAYGDTNGDSFAELPVSRIPDGRDAALVFAALQADAPGVANRFGIRNIARPFAAKIWDYVDGDRPLNVSEDFQSHQVVGLDLNNSANYVMLHGSATDGTKWSGEAPGKGGDVVAFAVHNVPKKLSGIVFAGCCWGALVVSERACTMTQGLPSPRVTERSIALSFLRSGVSGFVGSTGAHYSGSGLTANDNLAYVMHEAFWQLAKAANYAAAPALFEARTLFFEFINQQVGVADPLRIAQMLKNRTQFTCLGLGW